MDALVADVAIAEIPEPMPVVMNKIRVERLFRRGAGPDVEVELGWRSGDRFVANAPARLAAIALGDQELAVFAALNNCRQTRSVSIRAALRPVLNDAVVFAGGLDALASLENIVATRLLHVNIFARLAGPDCLERMPVVRRGDRDGINFFTLKKFAEVAKLLRAFDAHGVFIQNVLVHIAKRDNSNPFNIIIALLQMRLPAAIESDDSDANLIICARNLRPRARRQAARGGGHE